jgi:MOSC domain-containing protein YiiM
MKLISIQVGRPRDIDWRGEQVRTSIFKTAVAGPVQMRRLNLDGDEQSDRGVHGGPRFLSTLCASQWRRRRLVTSDPSELAMHDASLSTSLRAGC